MSANEFEGHEALIAQLQAGTLDAPGHLHRRVLAGGPAKRRRWADMSGRRRVFVVVPIAATLAVGAAVIQGAFVSSGPRENHALVAGKPSTPTIQPGLVGASGPTGPRGNTTEVAPVATDAYRTLSGLQAPTGKAYVPAFKGALDAVSIPTKRMVHADAVLGVVVANNDALASATNKATAIVTSVGGYAQTVHQGTSKGNGSAFLDLRVPVGKAEFAIQKLGSLGRLVSQQVSTQDLQQTFSKQTDVVGRLRREIAIYKQALKSESLSGAQRIDVQIKLANAQHQLNAMLKSRSRTVASAATANIQLTLTTDQHAFAAPAGKTGRLGQMLHNAAGFLALEAVIVLYALIVAGPILLLIGLVWWLTRERRRREERHLLASA